MNKKIRFKIKWKRIFVIPIILIFMLLPSIYVNSVTGYLGAVFFGCLLLISFLSMQYIKKNIYITSSSEEQFCFRGEKLKVGIRVENRSIFVAPKVKTSFYWRNPLYGIMAKKEVNMSLGSGRQNRMVFHPKFTHIGLHYIGLRDFILFDMLGFFHVSLPIEREYKIIVQPRIYTPDREIFEMAPTQTEYENGVLIPGGMDYMGIRDYEWGDPMKQIHWKLSARRGEYVTRLTESPRRSSHVILMDLTAPVSWKKFYLDLNDSLIELSMSLIHYMKNMGEEYHFLYANQDKEIVNIRPSSEEIQNLFLNFDTISNADDRKHINGIDFLEREIENITNSSNIILCTANMTEELIDILEEFRNKGQSIEVYFIVPKQLGEKAMDREWLKINYLGEKGIVGHMITTQINEENL